MVVSKGKIQTTKERLMDEAKSWRKSKRRDEGYIEKRGQVEGKRMGRRARRCLSRMEKVMGIWASAVAERASEEGRAVGGLGVTIVAWKRALVLSGIGHILGLSQLRHRRVDSIRASPPSV